MSASGYVVDTSGLLGHIYPAYGAMWPATRRQRNAMFLKFLDDMEQIEESRARMRQAKFRPTIDAPYRWRDWAAQENGITGPELIAFISQEDAVRPDGTKGAGLFAYLRSLQNGPGSRKQVVSTVFSGQTCRMYSITST